MAVSLILRVGDSSSQDISLTSAGVSVLDYPMAEPDINQSAIQTLGDGNGLSVPSWSNVTESIDLHISDSTAALVADKVRAIERLLDLARQGSLGAQDGRVYLRILFDHDSSSAWRSQILAAKFESEEGSNQIWKKYVRATLIITRRYYWEMETLQAVAVSSGPTSSATTSYATVCNADDTHATNRNWFQIAAAQVTGSIPAPAKIYIKNTSGATRDAATVFLGNYVFNDPANVDPIYRGEDAADSDTTPGTTEQAIYAWDLSGAGLVDDFHGQFGRFVAVWSDRPAITTLVRASVQYRGPSPEVDLALGEQFIINPSVFVTDLGALPIPPSGWISGMGDNLYLTLKAKAASGTDTLGIDWLQIFPSGAGRYRVLQGVFGSLTLSSNNEIIDDGPEGVVYLSTSGGAKLPLYRPLYSPIYLWPNKLQRLRLIISGGASFEAAQAWSVKVEVRPRRLSF